jgi:hypothetical protein
MALLALIAGLLLSGTAAYYSIIGLLAIFPGAVLPITLMGGSLEFAKLVAASWLYRNWSIAPKVIKGYFVFAILILMFITSLGTFGYLSKVHLETSNSVADNSVEITRITAEIESERNSIQNSQGSLNLMNKLVSENSDPDKANRIRVRQAAERSELNQAIQKSSNRIIELNKQLAPLQKTNLKAEAEIGPLKYVAELIYGKEAQDHFGSAVRFVIILIVLVFDPLAVLLLIAANISYSNRPVEPEPTLRQKKPKQKVDKQVKDEYNKGIKGSIYNFMMRDDYGIQHTNEPKPKENPIEFDRDDGGIKRGNY